MQSLTFNTFLGSFFLQLLPHNENKCHYFLDLLRFLFIIIIIIIIVIIIIITVVIIVVYLFILLKIQINNKTNYKNRSLQLGLFTPN